MPEYRIVRRIYHNDEVKYHIQIKDLPNSEFHDSKYIGYFTDLALARTEVEELIELHQGRSADVLSVLTTHNTL